MNIEELNFMNWGECERTFIKKVSIDKERIEYLIKSAKRDLEKARDEKEQDYEIERYYECIKKGIKIKKPQCLISYIYKENSDKESECRMILMLAYLRNRLSYYGEALNQEFLIENKKEIEKIIKWLFLLIK